MIAKCNCNHCSTHLEFEAENAGERITCPKCGLETALYIPHAPVDPPQASRAPVAPSTPPPAAQTQFLGIPTPRAPEPMTYAQGVMILLILAVGIIGAPLLRGVLPQTWEYQIVSAEDYEFNSKVDRLGAQGWELVFARRAMTGGEFSSRGVYEMIFKRPRLFATFPR